MKNCSNEKEEKRLRRGMMTGCTYKEDGKAIRGGMWEEDKDTKGIQKRRKEINSFVIMSQ
jgi:hypothetical protein